MIFESRPDVLVQLLALAIKSGNGMVLKGGREATHTLQCLFRVFLHSIPSEYHAGFALLLNRQDTQQALSRPEFSLIIPRGSTAFVQRVKQVAVAPVIGHGSGICCAYVHHDLDLQSDLVVKTILHAKLDYPAACNSLELIILPESTATTHPSQLITLLAQLHRGGIKIHITPELVKKIPTLATNYPITSEVQEYHDHRMLVTLCPTDEAAFHLINQVGSSHTDLVLTHDDMVYHRAEQILRSSCLFKNCSTRAADGYRMKMGCEVGINTTSTGWFRGPVGLEALMTTQIRLTPVTND